MSGHASVNFSGSDQGLFSPAEVRHLMRVEYERAVRYAYPITLMLMEVDRLEALHDLYGVESKEEVLASVIGLLRANTRSSDFLGCLRGERIMAVFPHTPKAAVTALAGRLLGGCRELEFRTGVRALRATLSIGVSARKGQEQDFGGFVRTAEEALAFAIRSGGDRFVLNEAASDVIESLREELVSEERRLAEEHARAPVPAPAPVPMLEIPDLSELPPEELRDRVRALFGALSGHSPEMARLEQEVLSVAEEGVRAARDAVVSQEVAEHREKVDLLERRVHKLKALLDEAELELGEIARRRGLESGIASIYRSVQGLTGEESDFDRKKEMLTLIFEANVELQRKIRPDS